jgi:CBS domain containing-hemolysin-like protein
MELPYSKNTTLAGVVQETLQEMPEENDEGNWGPFHFQVITATGRADILVRLRLVEPDGAEEDA